MREITESSFQRWVGELAELYGWRVNHTPDSRLIPKSMVGFPDLTLFSPNGCRVLYRELKSRSGTLTTQQEAWGAFLRAGGHDWTVWRPAHRGQIQMILEGRAR